MFSIIDRLLGKLLLYLSSITKTFFVLQPLRINSISINKLFLNNYDDITVLIQGPVLNAKNFDFLCNTIKFYINLGIFNFVISLSNDLYYNNIINYCNNVKTNNRDISVEILLVNLDHICPGISNINYQRQTVIDGLINVKTKYVLKQRVDQRFSNENSFEFFKNLIKSFPSRSTCFNSRIIVLSSTSLLFVSHHICDFLQFGLKEDLYEIWDNVEYSKTDLSIKNLIGKTLVNNYIKDYNNYYRPEIYLGYAIKKKYDNGTFKKYNNYINIVRDALIIINQTDIGLIWDKYSTLQILPFPRIYNQYERISFDLWLSIYYGKVYYIPRLLIL